jgi:hypothetical protein
MTARSPDRSVVVAVLAERPSRIVVASCLVTCAVGLAEFGILTLLASLNVSRLSLRIQNSVVTGVIAGACVWALLVMVSFRQRYLRTKLQVVADLNHELRNALEVIVQSGYLPGDKRDSALLDSAERINKALTELVAEAHGNRFDFLR